MEHVNPEGNGTHTLESATTAIADILERDEAPTEGNVENESAPVEDDQVQAEANAAEENPESETEEAADEDHAGDEPTENPVYTIKVDGEEMEVSLDELRNGYLRDADYRRKTQQIAGERRQMEAALQEHAERLRQDYAAAINQYLEQAENLVEKEPDWDVLYQSDPLDYIKKREEWREKKERVNAALAERQRLAAIEQQKQAEHLQARLSDEEKSLLEKLPEWKDAERATTEKKALAQYALNDLGFSADEVSGLYDHRILLMLRKAHAYDRLMSKKPEVGAKVAGKPKVIKPGSASNPKAADTQKRAQKFAFAKKSGTVEAAASVIFDML